MNFFAKTVFLTLFAVVLNNFEALAGPINKGRENDTSNLKSNIVLFKMITAPSAPSAAPKGKTLKKAGSVARTSNSHVELGNKSIVPEG